MPRLGRQTMHAGVVAVSLFLVAGGAMDALQRDVVIRMLDRDIGVATKAGVGFVGGGLQLGFIHEQRNGMPGGVSDGKRLIGVTIQAITVLQSGPGWQGEGQDEKAERQMPQTVHNNSISAKARWDDSTWFGGECPFFVGKNAAFSHGSHELTRIERQWRHEAKGRIEIRCPGSNRPDPDFFYFAFRRSRRASNNPTTPSPINT